MKDQRRGPNVVDDCEGMLQPQGWDVASLMEILPKSDPLILSGSMWTNLYRRKVFPLPAAQLK